MATMAQTISFLHSTATILTVGHFICNDINSPAVSLSATLMPTPLIHTLPPNNWSVFSVSGPKILLNQQITMSIPTPNPSPSPSPCPALVADINNSLYLVTGPEIC